MDDDTWYWGEDYGPVTHPGLFAFLSHSDCKGELSPEDCTRVADDLRDLLLKINAQGTHCGTVDANGGYGGLCSKFIDGCRLAAERGQALEFY